MQEEPLQWSQPRQPHPPSLSQGQRPRPQARPPPRRRSGSAGRVYKLDESEAICSAVRHGRHEALLESLDAGVSVDTVDAHGNTLLIIAAQNNQPEMLRLLAQRSADVNKQNRQGNTALHYACAFKFKAVSDLLDGFGADDGICNEQGELPCQFSGARPMAPRPPKTARW